MEPVLRQNCTIPTAGADRYGRMKPSWLLYLAQEMAGEHSAMLNAGLSVLNEKHLFWAVTRHKVQITRLPKLGETITLETWPMPTTRVAYPRSTIAYDAQGRELFRSISLWVLMDQQNRSMILPGKSGVEVNGLVRGGELSTPGSLVPKPWENQTHHRVAYSELDRNGHANNTRYLDWIDDLLPSAFHAAHSTREFTICYSHEALETDLLGLDWELQDGNALRVDAHRDNEDGSIQRIFSAQVIYD